MRWFVLRLCGDFFYRPDNLTEAIAASQSARGQRRERPGFYSRLGYSASKSEISSPSRSLSAAT